jgi:hypothetical protein
VSIPIERYTFVPAEPLLTPPANGGQCEVIADSWWATRNGDLVFYQGRSPQCNRNWVVTEKVSRSCPWDVEIVHHAFVYLPYRESDVYVDGEYDGVDRKYFLPTAGESR